jgi:hypothetical protein
VVDTDRRSVYCRICSLFSTTRSISTIISVDFVLSAIICNLASVFILPPVIFANCSLTLLDVQVFSRTEGSGSLTAIQLMRIFINAIIIPSSSSCALLFTIIGKCASIIHHCNLNILMSTSTNASHLVEVIQLNKNRIINHPVLESVCNH